MIELFDTPITPEAERMVLATLRSKRLSEGELVATFEGELERIFGYRNGVAVNSGTSALHLSLILSEVGKGDEVILPAQTFIATGMAVLYCGARCVFADIDKNTGNISVDSVSKLITSRTKAVIAVSWGGNPCDLYGLESLCARKGIRLIQDNAHALGAEYYERPISEFGDFSCFSFQAIKHVTTGDGGLLVCRSDSDCERAKRLRWFGIDRQHDLPDETGERKYNIHNIGYKYHMNDYCAALGLGNLANIRMRNNLRLIIAARYDLEISGGVKRFDKSANWLYTILVDRRNEFIARMKERGIVASVVHNGIDGNMVFQSKALLPNQRYWDEHHVCIPCHSGMSTTDVDKVVEAWNAGW